MRTFSAIAVLGTVFASACSGGDNPGTNGGAPSSLHSGLPPGQAMNTLTPAEAQQFCSSAQAWAAASPYRGTMAELDCRIRGLLAVSNASALVGGATASPATAPPAPGSEPTMCKAAYDACKQTQAEGADRVAELAGRCNVAADCSATVAEVETCINGLSTKVEGVKSGVPSCDGVTTQSASDGLTRLLAFYSQEMSGDCAPVATKCASMNPLGGTGGFGTTP